jgi:sugar phosphate isomerase/epimerase
VDLLLESPRFALTWDVGHSLSAGEADRPFLLARRDRIAHFHIHDAAASPPRCHLALGDGEMDLRGRLALAASLDARCVLETKTAEALARSVDWLKANGLF